MTVVRKKNKIAEKGHQGNMMQKASNIFFFLLA